MRQTAWGLLIGAIGMILLDALPAALFLCLAAGLLALLAPPTESEQARTRNQAHRR